MHLMPIARILGLVGLVMVLLPYQADANATHPLGTVRSIHGGLTVQPPGKRQHEGRVRQHLYGSYRLRTQARQKASLGFFDGSVLYVNQRTDLTLRDPRLTSLKRGEVASIVVRGKRHSIQTGTALAADVGTEFDVRIAPSGTSSPYPGSPGPTPVFPAGTTTVSVVQGAVAVSNRYGNVTVHAGQWTHVRPGKAPTKPVSHNARADIAWTSGLAGP